MFAMKHVKIFNATQIMLIFKMPTCDTQSKYTLKSFVTTHM